MEKVTIIIATYNRAHLIRETLISVQNQVYKNWECFIIDDGSLDDTFDIIEPFLIADNRFDYIKRPDNYRKGLSGCRNYGLDLAKGEFVQFCDDDDIMHPNHLLYCIRAINGSNIDFVHFRLFSFIDKVEFIDDEFIIDRELNIKDFTDILTFKLHFISCSVFWKIDCFKNDRFNEYLNYAEEWELYLRILAEDREGVMLNNVLYFNRKHRSSNTANYFRKNKQMIKGKVKAVLLVIALLYKKKLFNKAIVFYLIGVSLQTGSIKILMHLIKNNFSKTFFIMRYFFKMYFYKLLKK